MASLTRRLNKWCRAGLIDEQQVVAIEHFEAGQPSWLLRGLLGLAVTSIGIGVIALVASHWENIPDVIMLGLMFVLLVIIALGAWAMKMRNNSTGAELFIFAFLIACLAAIGLISQTFNLSGRLDHALLFWGLIVAPITVMTQFRLVPALWLWVMLVVGLVIPIVEWVDQLGWLDQRTAIGLVGILPITTAIGLVALNKLRRFDNFEWAFRVITVFAWFSAIVIFDISLSWEAANPTNKDELSGASLMVSFGTLLSLFVFALAWFWEIFPRARLILIGVQLGIYLSFLALASLTNGVPYLGSVFVILLFGFCATDMARAGRRGAAQFLLVLIGIRMLTFYIDAFGGLAITAVGLICVGVLILLTTLVWYRKRHNVMSWLEGVPK